jgi:Ubiquitin family
LGALALDKKETSDSVRQILSRDCAANLVLDVPAPRNSREMEGENTKPNQAEFTINVKTIQGGQHTVTVTSEMTVAKLKEKLSVVAHIPVPEQRLIFLAKVLKDLVTLTET